MVEPNTPENLLSNTITPATFTEAAGLDYTQYPALKAISDGDSFDEAAALDYKAKAVEELTAAGASFPIQMYMRYNPATTNWDKECQVIEQQLEGLLGADYIDVVVEAGPSTNFLSMVRRTGDYGFMKCNWGADYADPQTWTDPFKAQDNSYNFMAQGPDLQIGQEPCTNKSPETQALMEEYYALIDAAKAITTDDEARYTAFAEAEAFLIEHAIVIPFSISSSAGYVATRLNVFEAQYAPTAWPSRASSSRNCGRSPWAWRSSTPSMTSGSRTAPPPSLPRTPSNLSAGAPDPASGAPLLPVFLLQPPYMTAPGPVWGRDIPRPCLPFSSQGGLVSWRNTYLNACCAPC